MYPKLRPVLRSSRSFHVSSSTKTIQKHATVSKTKTSRPRRLPVVSCSDTYEEPVQQKPSKPIKRNELGVQMLARPLHDQVFKNTSFPQPLKSYVQIAKEHLKSHGLDPSQGSLLPDTSFDLPPLQGSNLSEHFHVIGQQSAEPWLSFAKDFASPETSLRPKPDCFVTSIPGWTKYTYQEDGSSYAEPVEYPMHDGKPEQLLVFDVETMPAYSPYPVLACAASKNSWYSWISPWLLSFDPDSPVTSEGNPNHLIPFGDPEVERIVVGHNVSYDRARIKEEYEFLGTKTRFLDTMALHVAVKGISSHQRPAWMKHRKDKEKEIERREEAVSAVLDLMRTVEEQEAELDDESSADLVKKDELKRLRSEMEESLPQLQAEDAMEVEAEAASKRWEDITSANSLADVAKLHCGIDMNKEIRNDFMALTPAEIRENIHAYLDYCSTDVEVTYAVFKEVLPSFLTNCPSPVSFAGVLTMGSSFLTVNQDWEKYLESAERTYRDLESKVKIRLIELAEEAKGLMETGGWKSNVWLSQMDWTPKVAGKTRGIFPSEQPSALSSEDQTTGSTTRFESSTTTVPSASTAPSDGESIVHPQPLQIPAWYKEFLIAGPLGPRSVNFVLALLLKLSYDDHPMHYSTTEKWHFFSTPSPSSSDPSTTSPAVSKRQVDGGEVHAGAGDGEGVITRLPTSGNAKTLSLLNKTHGVPGFKNGRLSSSVDTELAIAIAGGLETTSEGVEVEKAVEELARRASIMDPETAKDDHWLSQLNWRLVDPPQLTRSLASPQAPIAAPSPKPKKVKKVKPPKPPPVLWPKWYWDLTKPKKDCPPGTIDITVRNRFAPLLLKLSWQSYPLFHSREYGWTFRVPPPSPSQPKPTFRQSELTFYDPADEKLQEMKLREGYQFYKLPHKDGEKANVGNPLAKTFIKYAQDGTLTSPGDEAKEALDMNAQCSYWISARDRVLKQMVVWKDGPLNSSMPALTDGEKWGVILPQVITMGAVTRRAIEKTWLTASNAKPNRVGSELKAMVKAPPGYSIVGADVDSEELWISSVMGDAQFGLHGATAIGWMTLEGTKAAGTDLHSKTAGILGISRDTAKVFNYSRIYGAGMKHAVLLLLQSVVGMTPEEAQRLAENLYASTKGKNTYRQDVFGRKFWFGGTESFVFNKLEEIALSDKPMTPALGCGVTYALSKEYLPAEFGSDYMPSRINWVVQSSGVDYLHLLIVSMDYLIKKYKIDARYLLSVHDEVRYLVKDEDRYRCGLALQIANLWTRCLFAWKLGMDDLPQGVAFFSAVDVDHCLRKEVDMKCVTPSQPVPIPPGESFDIHGILEKTNGGSLISDNPKKAPLADEEMSLESLKGYRQPDWRAYRANNAAWLRAQATSDFAEIKHLHNKHYGAKISGGVGGPRARGRGGGGGGKQASSPRRKLGNGDGIDWDAAAEEELLRAQPPL